MVLYLIIELKLKGFNLILKMFKGWGEFEITVKIYFHDPNEKPVDFYALMFCTIID